jgi:hypothetical protein
MNRSCCLCNADIGERHYLAKKCLACNEKNTGATSAINAVQQAVKNGKLAPVKTLSCVDCGNTAQCYDHRDYGKPLDVVPVCRKCNFRRGSAKSAKIVKVSKEFAIYKAGSAQKLSVLLGVTPSTISRWGKDVPQARVWQLKALRPEWFDCLSV